jgi:hypothetical protein
MNSYSYEDVSSTLSSDISDWSGGVDGVKIKLVSTVVIPREQYAPVKVYISRRIPGLIIYFDPKLVVSEG